LGKEVLLFDEEEECEDKGEEITTVLLEES
jgi:hypothetical protein